VLVPLHDPMHLAKEVATLQELSVGHFTLGVGMGWLSLKELYVGKQVPDEYRKRGAANPIKYTWSR
jgi:alkanesulfonate monooxygenase SsuD/methylene tetrahydromethanopterin reductase-like flavin-dependent oxidoreductase (luciferase family)